jgi:hypothetical protein
MNKIRNFFKTVKIDPKEVEAALRKQKELEMKADIQSHILNIDEVRYRDFDHLRKYFLKGQGLVS